jgi:hypothetical protein
LHECDTGINHHEPPTTGGTTFPWSFNGLGIPEDKSVVYPALWMRRFPRGERDGDEQAAYAAAAWLQRADRDGYLSGFLTPGLTAEERGIAEIEGWILGVD